MDKIGQTGGCRDLTAAAGKIKFAAVPASAQMTGAHTNPRCHDRHEPARIKRWAANSLEIAGLTHSLR